MINLFLDPYIFACPAHEEGLSEIEQFVNGIIEWHDLRDAGWANVYISEQTVDLLAETNSYPMWPILRDAILRLNIQHVQAQDVMGVVNGLLERSSTVEDVIRIKDILFQNEATDPYSHLNRRPMQFVYQYKRLLLYMCLIVEAHREGVWQDVFITRHLAPEYVSVNIFGDLVDAELYDDEAGPVVPCRLSGQFETCVDVVQLSRALDPTICWQNCRNVDDYVFALRLYMQQNYGEASLNVRRWELGNFFLETSRVLGFAANDNQCRRLLRACSETILGVNLADTHAIRKGDGGNCEQLVHGNSRAWRRDIDHEYHLHYWENPDGVEIASVVMHNDIRIPDPTVIIS